MVKITPEHSQMALHILKGYHRKNHDGVLKKMAPILRSYHTLEPAKLGKRLLKSLFSSWLSKPNEACLRKRL